MNGENECKVTGLSQYESGTPLVIISDSIDRKGLSYLYRKFPLLTNFNNKSKKRENSFYVATSGIHVLVSVYQLDLYRLVNGIRSVTRLKKPTME